jgi:hypothetical protein
MDKIRVWFPDFYTEYHREREQQVALADHFRAAGIEPAANFSSSCQAVFCGSIFKAGPVIEARWRGALEGLPVVHYNWDIYPFQVEGNPRDWLPYLKELKAADLVLVPSDSVTRRMTEYIPHCRLPTIIHSCVRPWEVSGDLAVPEYKTKVKGYALNVMRDYCDPNRELAAQECGRLRIPLVQTGCRENWDTFKRLVAGARFLISPYYEASTGGLTLLEGLWHGVPSVIAKSLRNGVTEYIPMQWGARFNWANHAEFREALMEQWEHPFPVDLKEARGYIGTFSERGFANAIAGEITSLVNPDR